MNTQAQVRELPILFTGEMVRAILAGRKTQTRRVIDLSRVGNVVGVSRDCYDADGYDVVQDRAIVREPWTSESIATYLRCPFGAPGDRLWVRESFRGHAGAIVRDHAHDGYEISFAYAAGGYSGRVRVDATAYNRYIRDAGQPSRWRPSIFMPRAASRITLEVTSVRVERVQEITPDDIAAEGVVLWSAVDERSRNEDREEFARLWDQINGPRGFGWGQDPWVWVIGFRKVEP